MFYHFSETMNSEVMYKQEKFIQEIERDRQARQANRTRDEKRNRRSDVLLGVKRGKLSIEEGLNLLENA